ncbi:U3 small nucleolar ribonucleoprotein IMP4-like [Petromyzon marinus]|uniref:U3 small nucleolar ribonucleoprotein IMP4-like n=1 Tax=Petromyzon marinus TaxID=7757 RepID=UPI003F71F1B2
MATTSRDPSSLLKRFIKEMKLILPNAQPMNHGGHKLQALVWACCANAVNDFIVLHEHRVYNVYKLDGKDIELKEVGP